VSGDVVKLRPGAPSVNGFVANVSVSADALTWFSVKEVVLSTPNSYMFISITAFLFFDLPVSIGSHGTVDRENLRTTQTDHTLTLLGP